LNKLLTVSPTKRNENTANAYAKDSGFEGNFFFVETARSIETPVFVKEKRFVYNYMQQVFSSVWFARERLIYHTQYNSLSRPFV